MPLAGRPMVEWSIAAFAACESVAAIVVAVPPSGHQPDIRQMGPAGAPVATVAGGSTRAQSVSNALAGVETELVAIHDAARPLLTPDLITAIALTLESNPEAAGAIAATPVTDTIKRDVASPTFSGDEAEKGGRVIEATVDRSRLWAAQTPQVFRVGALREALAVAAEVRDVATDEAALVEAAGGTVLIHPTAAENMKVTTPLDLRLAELLLAARAGS